VAAMPHSSMADNYGCSLENSAKHKNVFLPPVPTVPKTLQYHSTANGLSYRAKSNKKKKKKKNNDLD